MTTWTEVTLAQALVQTPSYSGEEAQAAELLVEAFNALGFDEAYRDAAGNAIGVMRCGPGPHLMLNGHLDTVPVGEVALWPHAPLSGAIVAGELWGRGAVDMKSALACMALAACDARERGFRGTLTVSGVVQEEVGGLGARYLGERLQVDAVVLGEPSNLSLMLGHRGRAEVTVTFPGKIAHAARGELGENALYRAARFLLQLEQLALPQGGPLGGSSVTPTNLRSFPERGHNVVPGAARLVLDYRFIPDDPPEALLARLQQLAPEARFEIKCERYGSESGEVAYELPQVAPAYLAPGENRYLQRARAVIRAALAELGLPYSEGVWWFATDAPHLAQRGAPVIGLGPGDPELAHTTFERVPLAQLAAARRVYAALVLGLAS